MAIKPEMLYIDQSEIIANHGTEIQMIREILKFHPVLEAGVARKWSVWSKGAYGGTGNWDNLKLIYAERDELAKCLHELIAENKFFNSIFYGNG